MYLCPPLTKIKCFQTISLPHEGRSSFGRLCSLGVLILWTIKREKLVYVRKPASKDYCTSFIHFLIEPSGCNDVDCKLQNLIIKIGEGGKKDLWIVYYLSCSVVAIVVQILEMILHLIDTDVFRSSTGEFLEKFRESRLNFSNFSCSYGSYRLVCRLLDERSASLGAFQRIKKKKKHLIHNWKCFESKT